MARLETLGGLLELVVGAFGEASADLGRTIKALAESRVLYLSRETGKPVTEGWSSVVLSQYRRYFSVLFVRVQAACLTASLPHCQDGPPGHWSERGSWQKGGYGAPGAEGKEGS